MNLQRVREAALNGVSFMTGRTRNFGAPWQIMIEPTNICNFKCVYCPQSVPKEHFANGKGFMTLEQYELVIKKITAAWPRRKINLIRDGEPTLHKNIIDFVRIAADHGHKPQFTTNMSKMTEELATALLDAGLAHVKSDFTYDKELYERLRVNSKWERTRDGIISFAEAVRKSGKPITIHVAEIGTYEKTPEESEEILEKFRAVFPDHSDMIHVFPTHFHNALGEAAENLSQATLYNKKKSYNLCHHPWMELVINFKGEAVGCCRDLRSEYVLGSVLDCEDIKRDIWNGPRMRELRQTLIDRKPEAIDICAKCDIPYGSSYAGASKLEKAYNFLFK